jgi:uncharacterized membrane protein YgaE (UPF0421/DUF939 family)
MKKTERKVLRAKLLTAVKKVLKENKDELKDKTIKAINKSIKQIAKKTDKLKILVVATASSNKISKNKNKAKQVVAK